MMSSTKKHISILNQRDATVVLLVRDSERYIRECLLMLIAQIDIRWDVCIIYDDNTDDTMDIVKSVFPPDGKGITYIHSKVALSSSRALLEILESIKTPFIAFMESYDRWTNTRALHSHVYALSSNADSLISLCNAFEYNEKNATFPLSIQEHSLIDFSLADSLKTYYAPHLTSFIMRREALSFIKDIEVPTFLAACAWALVFNDEQRMFFPSALSVHTLPMQEMSATIPILTLLHQAYLRSIKAQITYNKLAATTSIAHEHLFTNNRVLYIDN